MFGVAGITVVGPRMQPAQGWRGTKVALVINRAASSAIVAGLRDKGRSSTQAALGEPEQVAAGACSAVANRTAQRSVNPLTSRRCVHAVH
jgi:hypothetical protein